MHFFLQSKTAATDMTGPDAAHRFRWRIVSVTSVFWCLLLASLAASAQTAGVVAPTFNTASLGLLGTGVGAVAVQADGKIVLEGQLYPCQRG